LELGLWQVNGPIISARKLPKLTTHSGKIASTVKIILISITLSINYVEIIRNLGTNFGKSLDLFQPKNSC
jgi:hypothetical protein